MRTELRKSWGLPGPQTNMFRNTVVQKKKVLVNTNMMLNLASELDRKVIGNVFAGQQESADNLCVNKMASVNKSIDVKQNRVSRKQLLEELNEKRESHCLVERSNQVSFLRVQKRHFSQAHKSSACVNIKESVPESGRTSWVKRDLSVCKEKRHFPPKSVYNLLVFLTTAH
ncbi:hypothetical protein A6R68_02362 [Neotoma lepida]|uniref:Spermatogenesis-associated protein 45 n=1 Tax=Neotoma lepida TaxID=56216 RepID=A0A1A6GTV2_NEOLE|nr:hypothetical protein A6R68_02362 [Neotoma lepida]